jgi:RNA polymerase sigma factor (sigma-70 family)
VTTPGEAAAQRLAQGDQQALEDCYRVYGPLVRSYLRRFLPADDIDDVMQLTFLGLWQARTRIDPTLPIEPLLFTIARRRVIDTLRRRPKVEVEVMRDLMGDDGGELAERMAWAAEIRWALTRLPDEQRQAIELAYFAQLTQSQIARQLEVPIGTVKARVWRGLDRLAEVLQQRRVP